MKERAGLCTMCDCG